MFLDNMFKKSFCKKCEKTRSFYKKSNKKNYQKEKSEENIKAELARAKMNLQKYYD